MEQATVEPAESTLNDAVPTQAPVKPQRQPTEAQLRARFTSANAAEIARKRHAKEREELEQLTQAANPSTQDDIEYRKSSLTRTRALINKLETELESSANPQASHYLVSSIAKLRDAEQKLAMRPLPGSHRPSKSPSPKPASIEPSE